jgi:hypothetical protein
MDALRKTDYAALAIDDIERAYNNESSMAKFFMSRAQVYALLSIAQEISKVPANMPEYIVTNNSDD